MRLPAARTAAYAPSGRRTQWWGAAKCAKCRGTHMHRADSLDHLAGVRRAGCGRGKYIVLVVRVYRTVAA